MHVLFLSRKRKSDVGGLARFYNELSSRFPKKGKIDLIHLCDTTLLPLGILLKVILQKPLTVTAHGLDLTYPNWFYQKMLKLFLPSVDAIILVSHQVKLLLKPFNIPEEKIHIIPSGISVSHLKSFYPTKPWRSGANLPYFPNKLILLTVGNLVSRKGHEWFISKVLKNLSQDFIYLIVGDGPRKNSIKSLINKLKLTERILLLGSLTDAQLGYLLKKADIYVSPNQHLPGNFEGFGIAAGEAATMGLPVVASKVEGIPEVIRHNQNGWLVKPEPEAFISSLNKLKNPNLRKKLGQKASHFTKLNFTWSETAQAYLKVFQQLIDKN